MAGTASQPEGAVRPDAGQPTERGEKSDARPRIDIKRRLGRRTVAAPQGRAIPLPFGFAPPRQLVAATEPHPPRDLTVTVGADLVESRRRVRRAAGTAAVVAAAVGVLVGYGAGGASARTSQWRAATKGAHELAAEVTRANAQVDALMAATTRLGQSLQRGNVSPREVVALSEVDLAVAEPALAQRGVGSFNAALQQQLFEYVTLAQAARAQQQRLTLLLGHRGRELATTAVRQRDAPQICWAAQVTRGPHGPVVRVVPLRDPFPERGTWPQSLSLRSGAAESPTNTPRLAELGALAREPLAAIPVAATSLGPVEATQFFHLVRRQLRELRATLVGDGAEHRGLTELGTELAAALEAVGGSEQ